MSVAAIIAALVVAILVGGKGEAGANAIVAAKEAPKAMPQALSQEPVIFGVAPNKHRARTDVERLKFLGCERTGHGDVGAVFCAGPQSHSRRRRWCDGLRKVSDQRKLPVAYIQLYDGVPRRRLPAILKYCVGCEWPAVMLRSKAAINERHLRGNLRSEKRNTGGCAFGQRGGGIGAFFGQGDGLTGIGGQGGFQLVLSPRDPRQDSGENDDHPICERPEGQNLALLGLVSLGLLIGGLWLLRGYPSLSRGRVAASGGLWLLGWLGGFYALSRGLLLLGVLS